MPERSGCPDETNKQGVGVPPAALQPVLKLMSGPGAGRVVRLQGSEVSLGRSDDNDLVIDDGGVSPHHCKFTVEPGKITLVALESKNGTYVGGQRITSRIMVDGTVILLGAKVKLRFVLQAPEEKELEQNLYEAATRDPLTGALNRPTWLAQVGEALERATGKTFSLAIVELDAFAKIQEEHGPAAGEAALREFRHRARELGRDITPGRWGDERFIFFLPNFPVERAFRRFERLRDEISCEPYELLPGVNAPVTVSVGVAEGKAGEVVLEDIIERAEQALSQSKRGEGSRIAQAAPPAPKKENVRILQCRRQSRTGCKVPVWCQSDGLTFEGIVVDIGTGGLSLMTHIPLGQGREVALRAKENPGTQVRVAIRWCETKDKSPRYGTSFLDGLEHLRTSWVSEVLRSLGINAHTSKERRAEIRFGAAARVLLRGLAGSYRALLMNLGLGGLSVEAHPVPPADQQFTLELAALKLPVLVVWAKPRRCGLRFLELNESQKEGVASLVRLAAARLAEARG